MSQLRLRVVCALGALGLVAAVLFVRSPESRLWRAIFDAGHAPLFGLVAWLALYVVRVRDAPEPRRRLRSYATAAALAVLAGVGAEFFQFFTPRDADALDMARNVAGALAFLALAIAFDPALGTVKRSRAARGALISLAAALLVVVAFPVMALTTALLQRNSALPVLCDFETRWSRMLLTTQDAQLDCVTPPPSWSPPPSGLTPRPARVGRIEFRAARYPGLTLVDPTPDWSAYDRLCFDVFSEHDSTVALVLRIDDAHAYRRYEDRFNRTLRIHPGMNRIRVPLADVRSGPRDRALDLTRIRRMVLFANGPPRSFHVYVGVIRLE